MSNNETNKGELRIVVKQGQTIDQLPVEALNNTQEAALSLKEYFAQLLRGWQRLKVAIHHKLDHYTLGLFSKAGGMTLVKISILAIIMFAILKEDVALDFKMAKFVSSNTNDEKIHLNKHRKDNAVAASVSTIVNDLSPASPEELHEAQVRSYIERFSQTAIGEMDKFGIPASIAMAQAIIESRSGTSVLAVKNNNHFGIKCFSKTCPQGHCSNFTDDHHKDFFRKYSNVWDSWREHSVFLMKHQYKNLLKYGKDYRAWARGLRDYGYATDASYDKKLIAIIERYNLHNLDDL